MGLLRSPVYLLFPLQVKTSDLLPVLRPSSSGDGNAMIGRMFFRVDVGLDVDCVGVEHDVRCFWGLLEGSGAEVGGNGRRTAGEQECQAEIRELILQSLNWPNTTFFLSHTLMCILYINTQNHTMSRSKPLQAH